MFVSYQNLIQAAQILSSGRWRSVGVFSYNAYEQYPMFGLRTNGEQMKNEDVGIDEMTPALWQEMTHQERKSWWLSWRKKGQVAFNCLRCGFPTTSGQVGCESCC